MTYIWVCNQTSLQAWASMTLLIAKTLDLGVYPLSSGERLPTSQIRNSVIIRSVMWAIFPSRELVPARKNVSRVDFDSIHKVRGTQYVHDLELRWMKLMGRVCRWQYIHTGLSEGATSCIRCSPILHLYNTNAPNNIRRKYPGPYFRIFRG